MVNCIYVKLGLSDILRTFLKSYEYIQRFPYKLLNGLSMYVLERNASVNAPYLSERIYRFDQDFPKIHHLQHPVYLMPLNKCNGFFLPPCSLLYVLTLVVSFLED
jgi:hypothetical protein